MQGYTPLLLAVLQSDVSKVQQLMSEAPNEAALVHMLNDQVSRLVSRQPT